MATKTGEMDRTKFDLAHNDLKDHFLVNGQDQMLDTLQHFPFTQLQALADGIKEELRFVVVHFGLDKGAMRYGFSFTYGEPRTPEEDKPMRYDYQLPIAEPTHILVASALITVDPEDWARYRSNYLADMQCKRTNGGSFVALGATDALRVILPWESEVLAMYETNTQGAGTYRMVIESVSVEHEAETVGGKTSPAGFRHGVAFYVEVEVQGNWERMLDDVPDPVGVYKNKSADYGNLCPVRCNYYEERR